MISAHAIGQHPGKGTLQFPFNADLLVCLCVCSGSVNIDLLVCLCVCSGSVNADLLVCLCVCLGSVDADLLVSLCVCSVSENVILHAIYYFKLN